MHPEFCGVLEQSGRRGGAATLLQHPPLVAGNSGRRNGRGGCEMPGPTGRSRNATRSPPPSTPPPLGNRRRKNKHMTKLVPFLEAGPGCIEVPELLRRIHDPGSSEIWGQKPRGSAPTAGGSATTASQTATPQYERLPEAANVKILKSSVPRE